MKTIKCPCCEKERTDETYTECAYCCWEYTGGEANWYENEPDGDNPVSLKQAKALLKQGKNIWGDPLPKENK